MTDLIVETTEPVALVGGSEVDRESLNILQKLTDNFVAADGGADHLLNIGITPRHVIGDLDSISPQARRKFADKLVEISEDDTTDLEKVVARCSAPVMVGIGFLGGRIDHTFAALNVLARFPGKPLILMSETDCCFRCPQLGLTLDLPVGTDFAVLPMETVEAQSTGLQWDMDALELRPSGFVASSNRTTAPRITLATTGSAIVTVPAAQVSAVIAAVRVE